MPRHMPAIAVAFGARVSDAIALARAGDIAATVPPPNPVRSEWYPARVELLYELAYLRFFIEWETFLEQSLVRFLCGYVCRHGIVIPASGTFFPSLGQAEAGLLGGQAYKLWHDPNIVVNRVRGFLTNSHYENVIASHIATLGDLASIRHRIAHGQADARRKFDVATMNLAGRRYRGARPGKFLRDWDRTTIPPKRWLETLGTELVNLARQIA